MSDDFPDRRDDQRTTASFEEWLSQHAESQGISQQELFERLVSSYWTLNELVQVLDDSGNTTSLADIHPDIDDDDLDEQDDQGLGAAPVIGGVDGGSRSDRRSEDGDGRRGTRRGRDDDRVDDLRDRVETLGDRIDDIESDLSDERERGQSQDDLIEALADRLSGIEADLDDLSSESAAARESLSVDQAALRRRLDNLESDLDGRQKQLASEQERLRSRLDAEFDDLETILEYLVSQADDLDAGLSAVERRHDEAFSHLRWEREALQSLLHEAAAHDAHAGECEVCGERVDLDLLADPYCSECDALLTGIEERDKWLVFSDIIVTAEETPAGTGGSGSTSTPGSAPSGRATAPDASTSTGGSDSNAERGPLDGPSGTDAEPPRPTRSAATEPARSGGTDASGSDSGAIGSDPDPDPRSDPADGPSETDSGPSFEFGGTGTDTGSDPDSGASETDSGPSFEFGDGGSDSDPDSGASETDPGASFEFGDGDGDPDSGGGSDADTDVDAVADTPFGDLDDLKRQEESDEE